jgi:Protein of unknown function (DUF3108)
MVFAAAALAALLGTAGIARAEHQKRLDLAVGVYAGGFKIFSVTTDAVLGPDSYAARTTAKTVGIFDYALSFTLDAETDGLIEAAIMQPNRHRHSSDGYWAKRGMDVRWDATRLAWATPTPPRALADANRDAVLPEQTIGTTDLLTALIARFVALDGKAPCAGAAPIFDGRRRYNLRFESLGAQRLDPSRYSIYSGDATACRVRIERIAGYEKKPSNLSTMVDHDEAIMWIAPGPEGAPHLPVRLETSSMFGTLFGHLERATVTRPAHAAAQHDLSDGNGLGSRQTP